MKKFNLLLIIPLLLVALFGCRDNDEEESNKSNKKEIISFQLNNYSANINESEKQITLVVSSNFDLEKLEPTIEISDKATISPASGVSQDFTQPVLYTVRAEDSSEQQYTVIITREKHSDARIQSFTINDIKGEINDERTSIYHRGANYIKIWLKGATDVTKLKPKIEVSPGAKVSPASDVEIDFSRPVVYTVTAENGTFDTYTVGVQYSTFPSGLLYATKISNKKQTADVVTNYSFDFDYLNRVKTFTKTTKPFYIDESLVDGELVHIEYGSNGKISRMVMEEKVDNAVASSRSFNVSYPNNKTVHVSELLAGGGTNLDVITLNDNGKVSGLESNGKKEVFIYDKYDNLIEHTIINGGHKKIAYDDYNGLFIYYNAPHWTLLYTLEELIGTGSNNPLSIKTYKQNGELEETIDYDYKYDTRTRYPQTYNYTSGNEDFRGVVFLNYVFPYSINMNADK
ncbi:hypothetical protein FACS1894179_03010 [Bacteroidia bacterium]|nr:hypothetical protein FACS1894169_11550 [Bacteroidia bacterium]GHV38913.1 hypothetical protein FACS1894179_03010 [Bacteroidia bacterium]